MYRDAIETLKSWRNDPIRVPLLIRGARQVGKSWLIDEFGKAYTHYISINFEKDKRVRTLFPTNIDISHTLEQLSNYTQTPITAGNTLIFLDEIQEHPTALNYLRYFKEEFPQLHVIAAGSLIEFTIEKLGMPVGRVDNLYLYPLSFMEYLTALGEHNLRDYVMQQQPNPAIHEVLLEHLRNYFWLGGMPAVVDTWVQHRSASLCHRIQDRIIENYQDDFHKYAKKQQIDHVASVFSSIPKQLGQKFKYSQVDPDSKSYPIKQALFLLKRAGIAHFCYHSAAQHYPLSAEINEKKFKTFFLDIGISHRILDLDLSEWLTEKFELNYLGSSAEQFVAQELIAYSQNSKVASLYYWHNEARTSNAEVDFVIARKGSVIPVEVKSKIKGGMKSLARFLQTHPHSPYGLKISEGQFAKQKQLQEIPLYAIAGWLKR